MHTSTSQSSQRSCILLAEPDAELRESLRQSLLTQHDVVVVQDGQAALEAVERVRPSLVLAAVNMPRLDGSELIKALRRLESARTIPVIMVSAYPGEEFRIAEQSAGADDHLVKPFSPRELLARVGAHLKLAQTRREAADRERFQLRKLQSVYGLTRLVAQVASIDEVYTEAMDGIQRALSLDRSAILLFDEDQVLRFKAWRRLSPEYRQAVERHSPWAIDRTSPRIIAIESATGDPAVNAVRDALCAEGIGALAFVPLMYEGRLLGKFMLYFDRPHRFTSEELELAQSVADHTALAIGRLRSNEALQRSEERYRRLVETAAEGVLQVDAEARAVYMNRRMAEILGADADWLLERNVFDILHPDERDEARAQWSRRLEGESARNEWRLQRADGTYVWVSMAATPITDSQGRVTGAVVLATDVTQQRQAERELLRHREQLENLVAERTADLERSHQQLRLSERMAALGTLSAGLGHDMGNLLLPIRARIDALLSEPLSDRVQENVQAIKQCTDYLQSLTNGLRLLALDPSETKCAGQQTSLQEWWPNVEALLNNALPRGIRLSHPRLEGLPPVGIPTHKLTQAVFNLVKNAGDALRGREWGNVALSAEVVDGPQPASSSGQSGSWVRLVVSDDGPGMSREVKARATEPFFTTKTRSLSTGLGLSLVHGIVAAAGGSVEIESTPGQGATIALTLPAALPDSHRRQPDRLEAVVSLDDPRGRTLVGQVLASMGFALCESDQPVPPATTRLWVTDASPKRLEAARRFLKIDSTRTVLVAGPAAECLSMPGLISLGEPLRFSQVRDTIRLITPRILERTNDKRTDSRLVCR